jgi:hypothetical protein
MSSREPVSRWLWNGALVLMALVLAGGLALIVALALGWNNPRPTRPPDWQAPGLPLRLEATADRTAATLLGWSGSDFTLEGEAVPPSAATVTTPSCGWRGTRRRCWWIGSGSPTFAGAGRPTGYA